jgi:fermentation-respiration switch protein FrsA (DUF1100 family)
MFPTEIKGLRNKIFFFCEKLLRKKTDYILVMNEDDYKIATENKLCIGEVIMTRGMGASVPEESNVPRELIYKLHESEGKYITFGAFERYDIVDWCKYIDNFTNNTCEFILSGVSMGATTVLLAAAEPDMIKLNYITADCGFTSPRRIFTDVFKQWYHLPPFPILNFASVICKKLAKFSFDEFTTLEAVKKLKAPVTFIHGEADAFVIPQNSRDAFDACTVEKQLITVEGAEHGLAYIKDREKVEKELSRIFNNYFS